MKMAWLLLCLTQADPFVAADEKRTEKFRKVLEKNPDDTDACLQVGRHLCFVRGQWNEGLPLLAEGKDVNLKQLAEYDLGRQEIPSDPKSPLTGATFTFGEDAAPDVVRGDNWWAEAVKWKSSIECRNIINRAAYWYRKAIPKVDDSLKKTLLSRLDKYLKAIGPINFTVVSDPRWQDSGTDVIEGMRVKLTCSGKWCINDNKDRSAWCDWTGYKNWFVDIAPLKTENLNCLLIRFGQGGDMLVAHKNNPYIARVSDRVYFSANRNPSPVAPGELTVVMELSVETVK